MFSFLSDPIVLLSLVVFLPTAGALLICFLPKERHELTKLVSLLVTVVVFMLAVWIAIPGGDDSISFVRGTAEMQHTFSLSWIPTFNIYYSMGLDGISFPLIVLTGFLGMLSMAASWPIDKHVKAYCILFLLLETGMLGVFMALDFFLFYVFWEVMLLPMYFLIGVWGGPRREYAAIKFFLFTLVGGVLMLIAMLMLYFTSDTTLLDGPTLTACGVHQAELDNRQNELDRREAESNRIEAELAKLSVAERQLFEAELAKLPEAEQEIAKHGIEKKVHTFNILALAEIGQLKDSPFGDVLVWGKPLAWFAFLLLFVGFVIKLPAVPVHTWLPDAHVEAPTPISMILAGVLLKMGGYGVLRICYPICPGAGYELAWFVSGIGIVSMVYGAFAALAQTDFKRLVAYSSVSHMGYVLLGLGVWSANKENLYVADYWMMGVNGAMFQMIAHGLSSAGMFFLVGVIYERVHHRDLNKFGGLFAKMPIYGGLSMGIFFAGMGLPGLCGFWGEVYVVLATWKYSMVLAIVAASVVILTAAYILWTIQRVYLGPEYKGPHEEALKPMTARELSIATPLLAMAILFGVYPRILLDYMTPTLDAQVERMTEWVVEADRDEAARKVALEALRPLSAQEPVEAREPEAREPDAQEPDAQEAAAQEAGGHH